MAAAIMLPGILMQVPTGVNAGVNFMAGVEFMDHRLRNERNGTLNVRPATSPVLTSSDFQGLMTNAFGGMFLGLILARVVVLALVVLGRNAGGTKFLKTIGTQKLELIT